jgi:hypothetical protein
MNKRDAISLLAISLIIIFSALALYNASIIQKIEYISREEKLGRVLITLNNISFYKGMSENQVAETLEIFRKTCASLSPFNHKLMPHTYNYRPKSRSLGGYIRFFYKNEKLDSVIVRGGL